MKTNQNVWKSKSNHKVRQPIHNGCYGNSNRPSFLEKQLSHHQSWNGTCYAQNFIFSIPHIVPHIIYTSLPGPSANRAVIPRLLITRSIPGAVTDGLVFRLLQKPSCRIKKQTLETCTTPKVRMPRTKCGVLKFQAHFSYLEAEHASEEGEENGHSSDTIEHEGTSAQLFN